MVYADDDVRAYVCVNARVQCRQLINYGGLTSNIVNGDNQSQKR